MGLFGP
jgi:ABC-2 type transport system permease protein